MEPAIIGSEHAKEMLQGERSEIGAARVEAAIRSADREMAADDEHPGRRVRVTDRQLLSHSAGQPLWGEDA
jgi:hypothetical protein